MGWTSSRSRAGLLPRKAGASRGISAGRLGNGWCTGAGLAWLGHLGRRSRTGTRVAGPRGCGRLLVVERRLLLVAGSLLGNTTAVRSLAPPSFCFSSTALRYSARWCLTRLPVWRLGLGLNSGGVVRAARRLPLPYSPPRPSLPGDSLPSATLSRASGALQVALVDLRPSAASNWARAPAHAVPRTRSQAQQWGAYSVGE